MARGGHVRQGEGWQQKGHETRVHERVARTGRTFRATKWLQLVQKRQEENQHHDHHHGALPWHRSWVCTRLNPGPQGVPVGVATEVLIRQRVWDHPHPAVHLELGVVLGVAGTQEQVVHHTPDWQVHHDSHHRHEVRTGWRAGRACGDRQDWVGQRLGQEPGRALRCVQLLRHHDQVPNGSNLRWAGCSWVLGLLRRVQPHQWRCTFSLRHPSGRDPGCVAQAQGCHQLRRHAH